MPCGGKERIHRGIDTAGCHITRKIYGAIEKSQGAGIPRVCRILGKQVEGLSRTQGTPTITGFLLREVLDQRHLRALYKGKKTNPLRTLGQSTDDFFNQYELTDPHIAKEAHRSPFRTGAEQVNHLNAGF